MTRIVVVNDNGVIEAAFSDGPVEIILVDIDEDNNPEPVIVKRWTAPADIDPLSALGDEDRVVCDTDGTILPDYLPD